MIFKTKQKTVIDLSQSNNEIHKEGDIWEDNGKEWTIEDGIKISKTKTSYIKQTNAVPLICPICKKQMNSRQDTHFWNLKYKCFDCVVKEDTEKIINNDFNEIELVNKNKVSFLEEFEDYIEEYKEFDQVIHETGLIERWETVNTKEEKEKIIQEVRKLIEERKKE